MATQVDVLTTELNRVQQERARLACARPSAPRSSEGTHG